MKSEQLLALNNPWSGLDRPMADRQVYKQFGRNINHLRLQRKMTQESLAEKANISRRYLQQIEAGQRHPSFIIAARLRFALECSWEELSEGISGDPFEGLR